MGFSDEKEGDQLKETAEKKKTDNTASLSIMSTCREDVIYVCGSVRIAMPNFLQRLERTVIII